MLISNKIHYFRNFNAQKYEKSFYSTGYYFKMF